MLKVSPFDTFKRQTHPSPTQSNQYNTAQANKEAIEQNNLRGVLLNTYIKDGQKKENYDFSAISSQLLIPENTENKEFVSTKTPETVFDIKKAMKPLLISGGITLGALGAISLATKGYSKTMANEAGLVRPGDLARNINILEEPHFAMYKMLRDPSKRNMLGFAGVAVMSGLTLGAKSFIDGIKEIWIKKQNCDIEHDLQENLINVETEVFSGKLNTVNSLLKNTTKYFEDVLNKDSKGTVPNFKSYINFKGDKNPKNKEEKNKFNKNILLGLGISAGVIAGIAGLYKNWQKTSSNLSEYMKKCTDTEIKANIINAVSKDKPTAIKELSDILKLINAKEETMKRELSKIKDITPDEIQNTIKDIKSAQIFAQAPEALGGISEKIQYYCYINEERGHLYNWILNPENKFNKYLFLTFCAISSVGYISHAVANALKDVAVSKENAKSELNLRKKLITTEINNFKSKKLSAINPMIDNFNLQLQKGKSKDELKNLAENILTEIKNGPPYVYS